MASLSKRTERYMITAATYFGNAADRVEMCIDSLGNRSFVESILSSTNNAQHADTVRVADLDHPLSNAIFRSAIASAKAAKKAFEICASTTANTRTGHDAEAAAALAIAEDSATQLVTDALSDTSTLLDDDVGVVGVCTKFVCASDLRNDLKNQSVLVRKDGCVHGCVGSLASIEDRSLNQIVGHRKDSSCRRYCEGVATQPSVTLTLVDGESADWIDACVGGCERGYERRPPCLINDDEDSASVSCH